MFYLVNRPDGTHFAPAESIDPKYSSLLRKAQREGVEILIYRTKSTLEGMTIDANQKLTAKAFTN